MPRAMVPSEFLALVQHRYRNDLKPLHFKQPLFRCFDCKRWIPRAELPLRCSECSGPNLRGKKIGYKRKLVTQDAMICKNCVDKHDHLVQMVLQLQFDAYAHGLEKEATMKAMKNFAQGEAVN